MYAPNSSILDDKEKTGRILGTRHHYLVNVSGLPYSKEIEFQKKNDDFSDNLTSLSIFTLNRNSFFENIKYYQPLFEQH